MSLITAALNLSPDEKRTFKKYVANILKEYEYEKKNSFTSSDIVSDRILDDLSQILSKRSEPQSAQTPRQNPKDTGNVKGEPGIVHIKANYCESA